VGVVTSWMLLGLLTAPRGGIQLRIQPGAPRPGDALRVSVQGCDSAPSGTLDEAALDFQPDPRGFEALLGLSVELKASQLTVSVRCVAGGEEREVQGTVDLQESEFRKSELTVSKRFTNPSKRDQARTKADQRAFDEAFAGQLTPRRFSGPFRWPRLAEVTAPFGDRRLFNGRQKSQHYGTDLDGATGDPVHAANDGEVVLVRECFGSGNTVLLSHGLRLYTAYFHLSKFEVKQGEQVKAGALLGLVGKTGRVTGPHLHWGAKISGRWVNAAGLVSIDWD
jgi:murein DD-endopeptidase MepM/ murein hydrolase activator NlpD